MEFKSKKKDYDLKSENQNIVNGDASNLIDFEKEHSMERVIDKVSSFSELENFSSEDMLKGRTVSVENGMSGLSFIKFLGNNKYLVSFEDFYRKKYWYNNYISLPFYLRIYKEVLKNNNGDLFVEEDGIEDDYYSCNVYVQITCDSLSKINIEIEEFIKKIERETDEKTKAISDLMERNL